MKRALALLLTLLTLTALLTGCDCSHEYDNATDIYCNDCDYNRLVATWNTTIGDDAGTMVLHADGTGSITSNDYTRTCVWEVADDLLQR